MQQSPWSSTWGQGSASKLTHVLVGKAWFLQGFWAEGDSPCPSCWPKVILSSLIGEPFHRAGDKKAVCFLWVSRWEAWVGQVRWDLQSWPTSLDTDTPSLPGIGCKQFIQCSPHSRGLGHVVLQNKCPAVMSWLQSLVLWIFVRRSFGLGGREAMLRMLDNILMNWPCNSHRERSPSWERWQSVLWRKWISSVSLPTRVLDRWSGCAPLLYPPFTVWIWASGQKAIRWHGRQHNGPQSCPHCDSWNLWICYFKYANRGSAHVAKLRILRWGGWSWIM